LLTVELGLQAEPIHQYNGFLHCVSYQAYSCISRTEPVGSLSIVRQSCYCRLQGIDIDLRILEKRRNIGGMLCHFRDDKLTFTGGVKTKIASDIDIVDHRIMQYVQLLYFPEELLIGDHEFQQFQPTRRECRSVFNTPHRTLDFPGQDRQLVDQRVPVFRYVPADIPLHGNLLCKRYCVAEHRRPKVIAARRQQVHHDPFAPQRSSFKRRNVVIDRRDLFEQLLEPRGDLIWQRLTCFLGNDDGHHEHQQRHYSKEVPHRYALLLFLFH